LHGLFHKFSLQVKNRKVLENNDDPTRGNKKELWRVPYKIIAFVCNRLLAIEKDPSYLDNFDLMPFEKFKQLIFDVYDHRIKNAPELNGSVNSSYCTLSEHILMFYVDKYRRRQKAEERIVELLINLRYYYDHW